MPDDQLGLSFADLRMAGWRRAAPPDEPVGPATVLAMLRALAGMALVSRRHEADVGSALHRAGLALTPAQRDAALQQLLDAECIERIIPLSDGGLLVSVTGAGLSRAAKSG